MNGRAPSDEFFDLTGLALVGNWPAAAGQFALHRYKETAPPRALH
jgi:hypothetical protein